MNAVLFNLIPIIISALAAIVILAIVITLIIVNGKTRQARSLDLKSFEALAQELKADNEEMRNELAAMKEVLNSINKMMKEIE